MIAQKETLLSRFPRKSKTFSMPLFLSHFLSSWMSHATRYVKFYLFYVHHYVKCSVFVHRIIHFYITFKKVNGLSSNWNFSVSRKKHNYYFSEFHLGHLSRFQCKDRRLVWFRANFTSSHVPLCTWWIADSDWLLFKILPSYWIKA